MSEAMMPPPDDSAESSPEEAEARSKELLLFAKLVEEHVFPPEDSEEGLAGRLMAWQSLESQNPKLQHERDIPKELLCYYRVAVSRTKERFAQACRDNDVAFLQRLYKAAKLIAKGEVSHSLTVTGYTFKAYRELREELGHLPSLIQLRERAEQLRHSKISERHWARARKAIEPLLRRT